MAATHAVLTKGAFSGSAGLGLEPGWDLGPWCLHGLFEGPPWSACSARVSLRTLHVAGVEKLEVG